MAELSADFTGRTALVTGAARGIGAELARGFSRAGAQTFVLDVDLDELTQSTQGTDLRPLAVDITSTEDVARCVQQVVTETGRIDILVNNAGILRDGVLWKLTDDDWDAVLAVHVGGTFKMTRACVPHLRERGYGRIINVTSYTGLHGNVGQANYATAKAGIIGFTKTAAKELARFGITVNAVSPNAETRMVAGIPDSKLAELTAAIPLGRFGQAVEMWPAVAFLSSEEAGYVTGVVLPIDGGLSI